MMQVEIVRVDIPAAYSRHFHVPRYDVPILEELWPDNLLMQDQRVTAVVTGMIEERQEDDEWHRIQHAYSHQVGNIPAWRRVYPSRDAFARAFAANEWHKAPMPVEVRVAIEVEKRMKAMDTKPIEPLAPAAVEAPAAPAAPAEPEASIPMLRDLVDDRSLPGLIAIGITTVEELHESLVAKDERLLDIDYLTDKRIAKLVAHFGIE